MNLTYFRPEMRGNVEKNKNPVNIRFVHKTSDIRNLSENITSDVMLTGPPREILPGGTKTDTGPIYFLVPSSKLV